MNDTAQERPVSKVANENYRSGWEKIFGKNVEGIHPVYDAEYSRTVVVQPTSEEVDTDAQYICCAD